MQLWTAAGRGRVEGLRRNADIGVLVPLCQDFEAGPMDERSPKLWRQAKYSTRVLERP